MKAVKQLASVLKYFSIQVFLSKGWKYYFNFKITEKMRPPINKSRSKKADIYSYKHKIKENLILSTPILLF